MMERFGIGRVFGIHNEPGRRLGEIGLRAGALLAAADDFRLVLTGRGGHAAYPSACVDPVAPALAIGQALMTIPARRVDPLAEIVVSLTVLKAGEASNVVPETAELAGTVRTLDEGVRMQAKAAVEEIVGGIAAAFGVEAALDYRLGYPVLVNDAGEAALCAAVAEGVVGSAMVDGRGGRRWGRRISPTCCRHGPGPTCSSGSARGRDCIIRPTTTTTRRRRSGRPTSRGWSRRRCRSEAGEPGAGLSGDAGGTGDRLSGRVFRAIGHPVSWIGRLIAALDRRLNHPAVSERRRRWNGVGGVVVLVVVSGAVGWAVQTLAIGWFGVVVVAVLAGTLLAQRSLGAHVAAVAEALEADGVAGGRRAVALIVGRDPESLDAAGVARAAVESLAENFSDGVVAPVFWLAVTGLPGAAPTRRSTPRTA